MSDNFLDYLVTNARIVEPAGTEAGESGADYYGSLGIKDGKIAVIYPASGAGTANVSGAPPNARRVIDAEGGILTAGFIDVHAHSDNDIPCAEKLLAMGVTTAFSGNCGLSPVDFKSFFEEFDRTAYPVNQAEQAGHTELRKAAGQGDVYAPVTKSQLEKIKALAAEAFDEGASGFSFGLEYAPGAGGEEVLELAKFAAERGRVVSVHTRLNKVNDTDSLKEALDLSPRTGARVIISHLVYMFVGDGLKRAIDLIGRYRAQGADVWVDSGMYTAFASFAGSPVFDEPVFAGKGFSVEKLRAATGKYAGEYLDLEKYREIRGEFPRDSFIYDPGKPEDILTAYSLSDVMVSTDCIRYPAGQGHPQGAATYPFFLRLLVKEKKRLSLGEALRRCSAVPARALGYAGKGRVAVGADADLVVLDWEHLRENAEFPGLGDPDAKPDGIRHVFVNGAAAIENGKRTGVLSGKNLRRGNA
ncbi:MAG: amidohydrolase family protein [Treponema sp.]|jgi:N-acyl-D-amino-acid deacylase|nr:amidohydrolase family protein [Treponema sp.]